MELFTYLLPYIIGAVGIAIICCFENNGPCEHGRDPDSHPEGTHLD